MGNSWNTLGLRRRQTARRALMDKHIEHLNSCTNREDCTNIAIKVAMLALAYPRDCPPINEILEKIGLQLLPSKDERDLQFLLNNFGELKIAELAEQQLQVLLSETTK